MKLFYKKIISVVLVLSVLSGLFVVPASATPGAAIDYVSGQLWDIMLFRDFDVGLSFWKNLLKAYLAPGKTEANATSVDWQDAYKTGYLAGVNKSLGTSQVGKDGFIVPLYPYGFSKGYDYVESTSSYGNWSRFPYGFFQAGIMKSVNSNYNGVYISFSDKPCTDFPSNSSNRCIYSPTLDVHVTAIVDFKKTGAAGGFAAFLDPCDVIVGQTYDLPFINLSGGFWKSADTYGSVSATAYLVCTPLAGYDVNTYTDSIGGGGSRPSSIFGGSGSVGGGTGGGTRHIGKKDETGKFTAVEGSIFDEVKGTYMNPFDGIVKNVKNWTYDYTTRAYSLTLADDSKVNLTFGDENVSIVEGGKTYTFYYIIPADSGTPSPSPSPSTCLHDYVPTVTTAATCLTPGLKTFNCSKCKDSYTQQIPATGHTWVVKETVNTTYDATGALVMQGYTIFKCSVCGEEYKDSNGGGPPGGGGGSSSGNSIWDKLGALLGSAANGFITVLKTAVIKILDALVSMFDAINTKLGSVTTAIFGLFERIPKLFGGFTGFLSAVFPFFPPEVFDILTLSILILAAGALIRFFLKR